MQFYLNGVVASAADFKRFLMSHGLRAFVKNGDLYICEVA